MILAARLLRYCSAFQGPLSSARRNRLRRLLVPIVVIILFVVIVMVIIVVAAVFGLLLAATLGLAAFRATVPNRIGDHIQMSDGMMRVVTMDLQLARPGHPLRRPVLNDHIQT
jgi:hypothetical protein